MSFTRDESAFNNPTLADRPTHHVHDSSEPLPGARGARPAADYSIDTLEGRTQQEQNIADTHETRGANAFNTERPMDVRPTDEGGVAVGGQSDLPMGQANTLDKVIGKTEKVLGKVLKKESMHEKGELREAGGKQAAAGQARAAHD
ncbi:hypothetical protein K488DRAFT_54231 [Vararia minispora EC-137]|uniref:Uncharacterized protein n=1 Tax=Vararia minispora EC-137 TaxID=1314806 RepID=A0ACB8QFT3_9AGAM|nr:hypothetical protein K488DRAFT_54231 [Vararia minispora EC-137]